MTAEVHHTPDRYVVVQTDNGLYFDTDANFALDWRGEAFPHMPKGARERIYRQGVVHAIQSAETVLEGGPMPWPLGDRIIADLDNLVARQKKRKEAEVKTPEQMAKELGLPWPPRDVLAELDDLQARVATLERMMKR